MANTKTFKRCKFEEKVTNISKDWEEKRIEYKNKEKKQKRKKKKEIQEYY